MPIFRIDEGKITRVEQTTFRKQGIYERRGLQALLKSDISVISQDTLVVAEEFGEWEDSNPRIDLLCIDKDANLVVIELKRTEDGGHMELQAVRYAAMISALTFDRLIEIYDDYPPKNDIELDATESVLNFLDWREPDEEPFGKEVRIVLASADFSKEVTTSVMWLKRAARRPRTIIAGCRNGNIRLRTSLQETKVQGGGDAVRQDKRELRRADSSRSQRDRCNMMDIPNCASSNSTLHSRQNCGMMQEASTSHIA